MMDNDLTEAESKEIDDLLAGTVLSDNDEVEEEEEEDEPQSEPTPEEAARVAELQRQVGTTPTHAISSERV
jgi:hypothetical protein